MRALWRAQVGARADGVGAGIDALDATGIDAVWVLLIALLGLWVAWFPPSPDLAAQAYRIQLYSAHGFSLWDDNWYAGLYLPSYSLLFPVLGALVGLRGIGVAAATVSTLAFSRLAKRCLGDSAPRAAALFAVGAAGDLFLGRITYAVGISFAILSVLAAVNGRRWLTALLSLGCAAASPVAAVFLALAAAADLIANRAVARALTVAVPAVACTLALDVLFPEGGYESFGLLSLLAAGGFTVALLLVLPACQRVLRWGAWLYLGLLAFAFAVRTPMGSNAVRLGVLLGPAIWVGAVRTEDVRRRLGRIARLWPARVGGRALQSALARRSHVLVVTILTGAGMFAWQINGPLAQSLQASSDPSTHTAYYTPLIAFLEHRTRGAPVRIEVPFTRSHWEETVLPLHFAMARGWDRQVDTQDDPLFYRPRLSAAAYRRWLLQTGVQYVALCDAPLDYSSVAEAALIRGGLPYLRQVFASAHWRVFAVVGARPLASGPGRLTALAGDSFTLRARRAASFLVRVHYTPYWRVTAGAAAVSAAPGGYTEVSVQKAGTVTVDADLTFHWPST